MIMAEVLTWFLIITGFYLVFICHWLGASALFPRVVDRAAERYGRRPVLGTLLGLALAIPLLLLGIGLVQVMPEPALKGLFGSLALVPILVALLGSAGLAQRIGAGLGAPVDATQPWRRCLRGGIVLGICFLPPFLGWLMLGWVLVSGLGIALMAIFGRDPTTVTASVAATPAAADAAKPVEVPA